MEGVQTRALYRKLSFKSTMGFGKYSQYTVQQIIDNADTEYLFWVYYNKPDIDFLPDVLERIGITDRIAKPGIDEAKWESFRNRQREMKRGLGKGVDKPWDEMTEEEKQAIYRMSAVKKKHQRLSKEKALRRLAQVERNCDYTARQLQALNHGHGFAKKRKLD